MRARRAAGALWLALATCLHLFGNSRGTLAILALCALYALFAPIAVRIAARSLRAEAVVAPVAEGRMRGKLCVQIRLGFFCRVECALRVANLWTGERREEALFPDGRKAIPFSAEARHCGMLEIALDSFLVTDPLRLFERRPPLRVCERQLIRPRLFDMRFFFPDPAGMAQAERYARDRAGFDPGETRSIREYAPGDSLRAIHWKLSEKLDRLLTRELSEPASRRVLLVLTASRPSPGQAAAMAENFLSLSRSLAGGGVSNTLTWRAEGEDGPRWFDVEGEGDVEEAAALLLAGPLAEMDVTVDAILAYAHTVVFCDARPQSAFPGRVTILPLPAQGARRYESVSME